MSYPNGCHIAEVEIDPETGAATIARYTAVDDLGHVINPTLVEGQVHGGVMQGAGQVFGEHAVYDRATGQLLTASFSDYFMPRAGHDPRDGRARAPGADADQRARRERRRRSRLQRLAAGARRTRRSTRCAPLGITHLDMPFTPARLWAAIRRAKRPGSSKA